ncbi:MAG: S41 family peptidase [Desulfobacteraceae bacterium]|nr:S41 family peptidase [Desulfobacteraceae bacterium]MCF8094517.1 S41 family peptidase [Desulfobacteraceae bacterium]
MELKNSKFARKLVLIVVAVLGVMMASGVYGSLAKTETYEGLKLFSDVLEEIEKNYVETVDTRELIEKAITGMVESLDPHSTFMPPEAFDALQNETRGEFGGIGIVITKRDGMLTVVSPIEGTPASRAGIRANDVIIKVDGKPTKDMMLWEAVKKMRGEPGTEINITVMREGRSKPMELSLVRDVIPMESVKYAMLKPGYGYVWITNFRENTTDEVKKALADLEKRGDSLKGLILDLRDSPGGLLTQAVSVSDVFLTKGNIVSIRGRNENKESSYEASVDKSEPDYPVVVLINGGTASAAEIVAGALQDHKRALVLGTTSFGKGSVQTVKPLRGGYGLKYTVAKYYTPDGRSIQAEGIHPDLVVKRELVDEKTGGLSASRIKERDLENHLPGEMEQKGTVEKDSSGKLDQKEDKEKPSAENDDEEADLEKLLRLRNALYSHSDRDPEVLLLDSQVNRAYEILKGYSVFRALGEGKQ